MNHHIKKIEKATIIFLDLLGFSNHTKESIESTLKLLDDFDYILNEKINDGNEKFLNNFKYLIPFSDSYVIISNETDMFLKELSNLLYKVFMLNEILLKEYNLDPNNKKKVLRPLISFNNEGKIEKTIHSKFVYPFLVRGGMAYGEVNIIRRTFINNSKLYNDDCRIDIAGEAYVNAVKLLESNEINQLKGPRIFFEYNFYEKINDKRYINKIADNIYELLWPAYIYNKENGKEIELNNNFNEIFQLAYRIWDIHKNEKYRYHYFNFMQLLIDSTIKFFDSDDDKKTAEKYIKNMIPNYDNLTFYDLQLKSRSTPP